MSYPDAFVRQQWLESTKNRELRDAQNFRGVPGGDVGARLASQQGVRGAPIVDASCIPGLELFKVWPLSGLGVSSSSGTGPSQSFTNRRTGDFMWASAANLDLSLMMWNRPSGITPTGGAPANPSRQAICFGVMLLGDVYISFGDDGNGITELDVFGAPVSQLVLISGNLAWRIQMARPRGVGDTYQDEALGYQIMFPGVAAATRAGDDFPGGWRTNRWAATSRTPSVDTGIVFAGTQFPISTPTPYAVYCFAQVDKVFNRANPPISSTGGQTLVDLMSANYAGFRVYDFTLMRRDGTTWVHQDAQMPQSMSGLNTSATQIPDPNDVSQMIPNPSRWYIEDAMIVTQADRTLTVSDTWQAERTVGSGSTLTIASVASAAFDVSPAGETVAVAVAPPSGSPGPVYAFNPQTSAFIFTPSASGTYQFVFTALIVNEPGIRQTASLTVTVP